MALPSKENHSDSALILQVHAGDAEAEGELFQRYLQKLLRAVHKPPLVRPGAIDSGIAAQSALRSALSHIRAAKKEDLPRRDQFWRFLLRKLRDKVHDQVRRETRMKRGGRVTVEQSALHDTRETESGAADFEALLSAEATPEELLSFHEFCNNLLTSLPSQELRDIALLKINEGLTDREVSLHIGRSLRTVELKLRLIRETWEPL